MGKLEMSGSQMQSRSEAQILQTSLLCLYLASRTRQNLTCFPPALAMPGDKYQLSLAWGCYSVRREQTLQSCRIHIDMHVGLAGLWLKEPSAITFSLLQRILNISVMTHLCCKRNTGPFSTSLLFASWAGSKLPAGRTFACLWEHGAVPRRQ